MYILCGQGPFRVVQVEHGITGCVLFRAEANFGCIPGRVVGGCSLWLCFGMVEVVGGG